MRRKKLVIDWSLSDILYTMWGFILLSAMILVIPTNTVAIQFIWEFILSQMNGKTTDVSGWLCLMLATLGIGVTPIIWIVAICTFIYQQSSSGLVPTP